MRADGTGERRNAAGGHWESLGRDADRPRGSVVHGNTPCAPPGARSREPAAHGSGGGGCSAPKRAQADGTAGVMPDFDLVHARSPSRWRVSSSARLTACTESCEPHRLLRTHAARRYLHPAHLPGAVPPLPCVVPTRIPHFLSHGGRNTTRGPLVAIIHRKVLVYIEEQHRSTCRPSVARQRVTLGCLRLIFFSHGRRCREGAGAEGMRGRLPRLAVPGERSAAMRHAPARTADDEAGDARGRIARGSPSRGARAQTNAKGAVTFQTT
jgi:hypothetical protein